VVYQGRLVPFCREMEVGTTIDLIIVTMAIAIWTCMRKAVLKPYHVILPDTLYNNSLFQIKDP
jgi:hypothetical protein